MTYRLFFAKTHYFRHLLAKKKAQQIRYTYQLFLNENNGHGIDFCLSNCPTFQISKAKSNYEF